MTVDEARKIIGEKANKYTDEELEAVIRDLTLMADIAIEQVIEKHKISK